MKHHLILLISGLLLALTSSSRAATLFSNLGQASSGTASGIALTNQMVATEFLTGADASIITGLTIRIQNNDTIIHTFSASLYSDNTSAPGTLVATFTALDGTVASGAVELATFSHAGINLAANTQYWLALGINQDSILHSSGFVETASDAVELGSIFSNITPPNMYSSVDSGGTWAATSSAQNGQFSLEGTVVPEPGRASLFLAGYAMVVLRRRRSASSPRHVG